MAVSYDQALSFYKKNRNKFPGMTATQAADQMVRGGEIPVAAVEAAPTAIPVAAPVAAALAAAAPAPVVEAAPEAAPEPEPAYMNAQEAALAAYNLANPETPEPAAVKGKPVDYAAMADRLLKGRKREELEANALISRTAQIDPEQQKIIDERLARYGIELTQADKDRQQATWMAVAQAGMKMAQSQSPYFMQALASGMEAGIDGYSEAKAKAAEKKARLQDAKEELSMKAIELRAQAVKDAIAARKDATQSAAAETALRKDALGLIVGEQTAPDVIEAARLGNVLTKANIANTYSTIDARAAAGARAAAAARNPGGGGSFKTSDVKAAIAGAVSDNKLIDARRNNFIDPPSAAEKQQLKAREDRNNQTIRQGNSILSGKIGMGSGLKFLGPA
jgi:hypothetical protein